MSDYVQSAIEATSFVYKNNGCSMEEIQRAVFPKCTKETNIAIVPVNAICYAENLSWVISRNNRFWIPGTEPKKYRAGYDELGNRTSESPINPKDYLGKVFGKQRVIDFYRDNSEQFKNRVVCVCVRCGKRTNRPHFHMNHLKTNGCKCIFKDKAFLKARAKQSALLRKKSKIDPNKLIYRNGKASN